MVTGRPTAYGEFVLSFSFAVVPCTFSRVLQKCTEHTFCPWKCTGMRKKSDPNLWISSCVDVYNYIILLMLSIYFHCSQCRLYWGDASIINVDATSTTQKNIANPKCFCFCAVYPSPLFFTISCCWNSSLEEGIVFVLSLVVPLICLPRKILEQDGAELQHMWSYWEPINPVVRLGNRKDCDRVRGHKKL